MVGIQFRQVWKDHWRKLTHVFSHPKQTSGVLQPNKAISFLKLGKNSPNKSELALTSVLIALSHAIVNRACKELYKMAVRFLC